MISFAQLKKNIRTSKEGLKQVRLAVLADNASQLTVQGIKGYGVEVGIQYDVYEADYDQIDQNIFNSHSELYQFQANFVFINQSTERLLKKFYKTSTADRGNFAQIQLAYIQSLTDTLLRQSKIKVIVNNYPEINDNTFGQYAAKEMTSFLYQLRKLNMGLMELSQQFDGLYICDILSLQTMVGNSVVFDSKMYVSADMVYSIDFLPYLAKAVTDIILSINGIIKKCVILDLDNTLWGGIIGDDGMEGIQIGNLGIGKVFSEFQKWLKELKNRGIILGVCSKNTVSIAKEPFQQHPDMELRLEDIAVFVANWENKVDNIRYIQSVLNIGFDSIVFLDDNKFEREMVKSGIVGITVPDLPEDPSEYLTYLRTLNLFETASFTEEDEQRTKLYQEEAVRAQLQKKFGNEDEFLENLEMKSDVKLVDSYSAPRVAQLSQRSNQFNLRTIRYTEKEILEIEKSSTYHAFSLSLEDKFGSHGLISAIILKVIDDRHLFIDTWIMSCRVLKRGMENFTLNCIVEWAVQKNIEFIIGEYISTKKNGIVKDHYSSLGFEPQSDGTWRLEISGYQRKKTFITHLS